MKCQYCGKKEATFYYRSTVNGRTAQCRLCQDCAEELGYARALCSSQLIGDALFAAPFRLTDAFGARMLTEFPEPVTETEDKQPEALLQGAEREAFTRQVKRNALQVRLQQAIDSENYEEAAKLRDELRAMSA